MKFPKCLRLILLATLIFLTACVKAIDPLDLDKKDEKNLDFYIASEAGSASLKDSTRQKLSYFFLVEQFSVSANESMLSAIARNPPGGILFWNGNSASSTELKNVIQVYSLETKKRGLKTMLYSTDYEGGAINQSPFSSRILGVQRFKKGFTALVHPRWLGESIKKFGFEMCYLHGRILAIELKAVGINYPLSVVSDLATQSLTALRSISKDPNQVSKCLTEIMKEFVARDDIIFVTKHFPGIGLTHGDTHEGVVISDVSDGVILEKHLKPFSSLIDLTKRIGKEHTLSIMTTHAKFKNYDPENLTTESRVTINDLLKKKLGFNGLVVSDAMWMGNYSLLPDEDLMPVYLKAFLSGIDLLMIPGNKFKQSLTYFRRVYDGKLSDSEVNKIEEKMGLKIEKIYELFHRRVVETVYKQEGIRGQLRYPHEYIEEALPIELTTTERKRYQEIFKDLLEFRNLSPGL